jgi:hypothetical protein
LGSFAAFMALIITLSSAQGARRADPDQRTVSLTTLASAWLAFAALGWRAASPRTAATAARLVLYVPRLPVAVTSLKHKAD